MAKKDDLIKEAQGLGIEISPEDTVKTLQEKIDVVKAGAAEGATPGPKDAIKTEDKSGLKRIKVSPEQLAKLQADKKLVGYDPANNEAIINA